MTGRAALALALAVLASGCANGVDDNGRAVFGVGGERFNERYARADPSKVIAAELAFARAAQEKGQWTAFAEFAADGGVMLVPEPVNAKEWLKGRANPPQAVAWQPHQVWSSCDGTVAATKGAWQRPDGSVGYFTTVWERKGDGGYKWVMDQGDVLAEPLEAPEFVAATVADCQPISPSADYGGIVYVDTDKITNGQSRDRTLRWYVLSRPDGSRTVSVRYWDGTAFRDAISEQVAAE